MLRYFFNTRDGVRERDLLGMELEDHNSARKYAMVYAGDIMRIEPGILWDGSEFVVEVSDPDGVLLFTVHAYAKNAPAG